MSEVHAVKSDETLKRMEAIFNSKPHLVLYGFVWNIGCNTALRIGDLLKLKYSDVEGDVISVIEEKTGKRREIKLPAATRARIAQRRAAHPNDVWLFQNNSRRSTGKPVTPESVHRIFKEVGEMASVNVKLGTHSMRKTWGYRRFEGGKGVAIETICKSLNHNDIGTTLKYIGIDREEIFAAAEDIRYVV